MGNGLFAGATCVAGGAVGGAGAGAVDSAVAGAADADAVLTICVVAGTLVELASGRLVQIQKEHTGDLVKSRDARSGTTENCRVVRTFHRIVFDTITITFGNSKAGREVRSLTATPGHWFFVRGRGVYRWVSLVSEPSL